MKDTEADRIKDYADRIYGFAVRHTYSREEADELSQEILLTAVRELPKLKDESRFEPWLWGVARNVTRAFRRAAGKKRAVYLYDVPEEALTEDGEDDDGEVYDFLRAKVAYLPKIYRDVIILHYYDGLSTRAISEKLHIPEGTVTWRLAEARKKIKRGFDSMNETALRPVHLSLSLYGSCNYDGKLRPFPTVFFDDALSQNILYCSYEKPRTVGELAELCGVPAYYVEERVENLLSREAMVEAGKGRYQTGFVIRSDKHGAYYEENAEKALLPVADDLISALKHVTRQALEIDFYKAEKDENSLFYLFSALAFSYAGEECNPLPFPRFKKRFDGYMWSYIGSIETRAGKKIGIGVEKNSNGASRGSFSHTVFNGIGGTAQRSMMYDNYVNVCEDILKSGKTEDLCSLGNAVSEGYIVKREDGSLVVTTPAFTIEQTQRFREIVVKSLMPLMPAYAECVCGFVEGYKKLFPAHLRDDADRLCYSLFVGMLADVIEHGQKAGVIAPPSGNRFVDILQQFK